MKSKSGFTEGRSKTRPSARLKTSDKEKKNKLDKSSKKLQKAKSELETVLRDSTFAPNILDEEVSRFQKELKTVRKHISNTSEIELNTEKLNKMMLRSMLTMILDVIPLAEKAFRASAKENAAYALIALVKEAKEIHSELNMIGNVENQSEFIRNSIITPLFNSMAQLFIHEMLSLKASIDTEVGNPKAGKKVKKHVDEVMKSIGLFMTQSNEKISENIHSYLSGNMSEFSDTPKKKKRKT